MRKQAGPFEYYDPPAIVRKVDICLNKLKTLKGIEDSKVADQIGHEVYRILYYNKIVRILLRAKIFFFFSLNILFLSDFTKFKLIPKSVNL